MHYVLQYEISADYLEKRSLFRQQHLQLAWQAAERGELMLGGALGEPVESAMLLFNVDSAEQVRAFAETDPYVVHGLVSRYRILPWHTVVGEQAANPLR